MTDDNDCGCEPDDPVVPPCGTVAPLDTSLPDPSCEPDGSITGADGPVVFTAEATPDECDDWTTPLRPAQTIPITGDTSGTNSGVRPGMSTGITYSSVAYVYTGAKDNCVSGQIGDVYTYTLPVGAFTSKVSVNDANQKAITWLNTNGPALARQYGTCIPATTAGFISLSFGGIQGCKTGLLDLQFGDQYGNLFTGCTSANTGNIFTSLSFGAVTGCPSSSVQFYSVSFGAVTGCA